MNTNTQEISPQRYARIAGAFYLIIIVAGFLAEVFIRGKLIVSGDATATANNILASETLWRLGVAGDLLMHLSDIPVMLCLFVLIRPVNRRLALLSVLFNLIQTAVLVANKLFLILPLFLLGGAAYLSVFTTGQLNTLAYVSIKLHGYGFGLGLIFFGGTCLVEGYLIRRSGFLPRALGYGMQLAGVCYLVNSFALILSPGLQSKLFPAILLPAFLAELSLCLWLLIRGVDVPKWREAVAGNRKPAL
ncbi:MAG: DUF4386 domain-containing protein [Pyrinomonadaceae bacterium]